jgi:hypothetical protein
MGPRSRDVTASVRRARQFNFQFNLKTITKLVILQAAAAIAVPFAISLSAPEASSTPRRELKSALTLMEQNRNIPIR